MSAVIAEHRRSQTAATGFTIRDAAGADVPAIVGIYNAAIATRAATAQLEPITFEDGEDWLKQHSHTGYPFWIAEINERVAAWLSCKPFLPRCAYRGTVELSVYVDQDFRRRGVARMLLEQAIARAPSFGISAMVGLIFAHNESSLQLFERLGFTRWGLLPQIARVDDLERDLVIVGRNCAVRDGDSIEANRRA
jgi:L-amino acid N-acyltransferase YncA